MERAYFQSIEDLQDGSSLPLDEVVSRLAFNSQGLIPVIAQDAASKQVLMLAWMNERAIENTLATGRMTYWSRSRNAMWVKGETSGHFQSLVSMHFDCDGDSVLCKVIQEGVACHTGREHCFYLEVDGAGRTVLVRGCSG